MVKKVVHIISGLGDGGAEGVLTRVCLNSQRFKHVVVSLIDSGKHGAALNTGGIDVHCVGMTPGKPSLSDLFRLYKLIRKEQPDIVQTWMYHADLLGGLAAKFAGVHRILWGIRHSTLNKGEAKRSTILVARLCAWLSYVLPDRIICCANKARDVHAGLGYRKRIMTVIPNGYDLSNLRPDQNARARIRGELGVTEDQILVGMVGRFAPQKDHSTLMEALSKLDASGYDFRCVLVGKGLTSENTTLLNQAAALGIRNRVIFLGPRTDIPDIMNGLDLHVLSSSGGEGFPNVIAEAMACGTPCVSTDVGDAAEIIGATGGICAPSSAASLSDGISTLINERCSNPDSWMKRKADCRDRISSTYSLSRVVGLFEAEWAGKA